MPSAPVVTSPSGKRVRIPVCSGVLQGSQADFFNLTVANLRAIDAQMTGLLDGTLLLVIAKGRLGRFEATRITRVEDLFAGQPPAIEGAA